MHIRQRPGNKAAVGVARAAEQPGYASCTFCPTASLTLILMLTSYTGKNSMPLQPFQAVRDIDQTTGIQGSDCSYFLVAILVFCHTMQPKQLCVCCYRAAMCCTLSLDLSSNTAMTTMVSIPCLSLRLQAYRRESFEDHIAMLTLLLCRPPLARYINRFA
jgi:hypothetical protein